jgi:hypothetical protein
MTTRTAPDHSIVSSRTVYRIVFNASANMAEIEGALAQAIRSVGCLHGEAAVRLEAAYAIDPALRTVALDAEAPLGLAVARLFVGMCTHMLGEDAFRVFRGARAQDRGSQVDGGAGDEGAPAP